jgi:tetratricopeptide (TPR) repeat protein
MKASTSRANKPKKLNLFAVAAIKTLEQEIQAAWAERDMEKCILLLHKVLEINSRSADAWFLIARAYGMQYEYDKSIEAFENAVEITPKHERVATLLKAGSMASNFYDPTIAESYFEEAVELAGTLSAKLALAEFLLRIRKREQAWLLVDEAIKLDPKNPTAIFLWCRLHENRFEDCVDKLSQIVNAHTGEIRAKSGYQLAKMLDLAGDYDGAMQALASAKQALMPARDIIVRNRANIRARHLALAERLNSEKSEEWLSMTEKLDVSQSLAFLCGHPRSGTTLLEQVLDTHPEIVSVEESDNFFMNALSPLLRAHSPLTDLLAVMDACHMDELLTARQNFFTSMTRCLGQPIGARLLIDKNPSLTSLVPAIFRIFPEARFVAMIRDPRDVVLSCYMQSFVPVSSVSGNYLTLEDAAEEYAGVMGVWSLARQPLEGNICEVRYEDMVEDLKGNARRVLDFLGLEWSESIMDYDRHAREKVVRSPTAEAVTEKVHTRAKNRWRNYEKHLEPVLETLRPCLKSLGYE